MDRNYIRRHTALIVEKDGYYLQGKSKLTGQVIWSASKYDAWRTRERADAVHVAHVVKGQLWLFNPLIGKSEPTGFLREARA